MPDTGLSRKFSASVPAQGTAGTAQATIVGEAKVAGRLTEAVIQPAAAVTANATNYRIFTLYNRGSTGAGTTVMATYNSATTGLTDNDEMAMTLSATAADLVYAAGDIFEIAETVAASGVAHGGYRIELTGMNTTA